MKLLLFRINIDCSNNIKDHLPLLLIIRSSYHNRIASNVAIVLINCLRQ